MLIKCEFTEEEYQTVISALKVARDSKWEDHKCSDEGSAEERETGKDYVRFGQLYDQMTSNKGPSYD